MHKVLLRFLNVAHSLFCLLSAKQEEIMQKKIMKHLYFQNAKPHESRYNGVIIVTTAACVTGNGAGTDAECIPTSFSLLEGRSFSADN